MFSIRIGEESDELLQSIANDCSPFKFIPTNIGVISFSYSTNPRHEPYPAAEKRSKLLKWIIPTLAVAAASWFAFPDLIILNAIISVIAFIIILKTYLNITVFEGKDFFVGDKGFAIIQFQNTRDNIVSQSVFLFKDLSELTSGETRVLKNGQYVRTEYFYRIFSKPYTIVNGAPVVKLVFNASGTVNENHSTPTNDGIYYVFCKELTKEWNNYKIAEFFSHPTANVTFSVMEKHTDEYTWLAIPYITFTQGAIIVNGCVYDSRSLKSLYFQNGVLVIEHVNHSQKLFGLVQKGNIEYISLGKIGNLDFFLKYLQHIFRLS